MAGSNTGFPNLCRKATIKWKCNSLAQLNYLAPYFLTPRISCLAEWGWNNYNPDSLVDLQNLDTLRKLLLGKPSPDPTDPEYMSAYERIKKSKGNYDLICGNIFDYGYSLNESGGYDCWTTIMNANRILEGEQISHKSVSKKTKGATPDKDNYDPIKGFKGFIKNDLVNISSKKYEKTRAKYNLDSVEIGKRVFIIDKKQCDKNKENRMWLRMDLIQDLINAFFEIKLLTTNEKSPVPSVKKLATAIVPTSTAIVPEGYFMRRLNINNTIMCGHPFLKSVNSNVLVPNQHAYRFTVEGATGGKFDQAVIENKIYSQLFRDTAEKISKDYGVNQEVDDLKRIINPDGNSFPIYKDEAGKGSSGYYGYLKDLFINVAYFQGIVSEADSLLKLIEQLLQGINQALCQICQLKLIASEYGSEEYYVIDENWSPVQDDKQAEKLEVIVLSSIHSAYILNAKFQVKVSSEMMSHLIFSAANRKIEPDTTTPTQNVKANPILSNFSMGDRVYNVGVLKTDTPSDSGVSVKKDGTAESDEAKKEFEKRKASRSEKNEETFLVYYEYDSGGAIKGYIICELNDEFINYVLSQPDQKAIYTNNALMPGTRLTLEFLGISGINFLSQFLLGHAPEPYSYRNAVWQVSDIKQTVEEKNWTTTIVADVRPFTTFKDNAFTP